VLNDGGVKFLRRVKHYLIKLLRLQDSPKAIAGGIGWGIFVHFYSTCGFGALLAMGIARIFGTSLMAAALSWGVAMPFFPLFFCLNFITGDILLGQPVQVFHLNYQGAWAEELQSLFYLGKAFLIGSLINSVISVILIWWFGYFLLQRYRKTVLQAVRCLAVPRNKRLRTQG
jgi:uncharacterized protein (DUF2062 family)